MRIRVRLFAMLRERAGADELELELPDRSKVSDALTRIRALTEGIPVVMAVNQEYADPEDRLSEGDEVALIPPVSGGSVATAHVRVTGDRLSLDPLIQRVTDPRAGAIVTFSGITREAPELRYEAYAEMAQRQIEAIVAEAIDRHGLCAAAAEHRIGRVALSESSVLVAASAPHREQAFAGAREIIDRIKSQAPIWKKEQGEWVRGTQPDLHR